MQKEKILVLGKGFLGKAFEKKGFEVWDKSRFYQRVINYNLDEFGMRDYKTIINCIGKSNTRWCEKSENWEETLFSNGEIPKILSNYCGLRNKKFVHISTGCLYDRNDVPQRETDFIAAHCDYVVSKRVGEKNCNLERDLILRPRLYFGDFADKNNLLCKIPNFSVFLNEQESYTSVNIIVDAVERLLEANQSGIFNVACENYSSISEIATWIGLEHKPKITGEELRKKENLYLVNNRLDISKLKKFYNPPEIKEEITKCWSKLEKCGE